VADDAGDLGVDQLLGHGVADLGIGLVIFGDQFELDIATAQPGLGGIGFVDRQARAVFVVLAQVGDAAGERGDAADLDHQRRRGRLHRRRRGWLFLAAAHHGDGGDHGQREGFHGHVHGGAPLGSGNAKRE
jgi:hypothetical protein